MQKFFLFALVNILCVCACWSQEVKKFEFEAGVGISHSIGEFHKMKARLSADFNVEGRFNIPSSNFDCGLAFNIGTAAYKKGEQWDQRNRSVNIMLLGDYNLFQGKKVNPFIGVGAGLSFMESVYNVRYDGTGIGFVARPRIGVELFRHLRIAAFMTILKRGFNCYGLNISAVVG